ncbi:ATP-binding cassette domain-containing protein [Corynebacterium poyangense]|uniref:Trehalose import ATP-binding protein SugC n=1 Tax=Corynebacterium poyangense TaxID=2684405 RepID=A0A7H0SMH5_9CORY|nr:ATP-binding cassette domain-containing protein [Corynebacterium poyangense]MBZ8176853.1 ATP-binding cassette domain-containing protein [Corynebacterium poyangense]QNQ89750.1 ATP-binding cassette domain-containing protein [Corynebacterium poyangense]
MASVSFDSVTIRYPGADTPSVRDFHLDIEDGEFLVLVGPSGCGKSTTLRSLAGLEPVESGTIRIGGQDVTHMDPAERDVAMVFQNYALYPHMSVAKNMGFSLSLKKVPKPEIEQKVTEAAKLLGLENYLDRRPKDLSGGQRQRVAMGRAIVRNPRVFLMDEPLSNLDAKLRVQTRTELAALQRRLGTTTVYVTHDQVEAMTMGDRVAVLKDGVLQQVAPPRELYRHPMNSFVASFIGSPAMNLFRYQDHTHGEIELGIRPEHVRVISEQNAPAGHPNLAAVVDIVEELGSESYVYAHSVDTPDTTLVARLGADHVPQRGDHINLTFSPQDAHLFDIHTGERLD